MLPNGKPLRLDKIVALDPNHKNFAYAVGTDSKATEIYNPYFLKILDKHIDQLKSKRDKCKKRSRLITREDGSKFWLPSHRWLMLNARLQELYRIRREQTKLFLYTVANRLYHDYDAVGIGDYVPHGAGITRKMRRAMNNQSLNRRFKHVLSWVALRSGKVSIEWEEGGVYPDLPCLWLCGRRRHPARHPSSSRREVSSRRAWRFNGLGLTSGVR